ncbi:MAG: hypothetical protein P1P82_02315 [Bacteroidales bacterium]|nr:hypothetical protein [Bacteroidales bacterium]MDT8431119.1 hypothetical protein [Bacteroidales bacterium]
MKTSHPFLIVFILAVVVRGFLNFSIPLVPGLGGGYNLVQIRSVLENGHLALPDMPLLFYLNAWIVKVILFLFPGAGQEQLIIIVSKIIDTIGFPLLLYPLFRIYKDIVKGNYPSLFLLAVAAFAVLSYAPLDLACDAQKNSLGLTFMTFFTLFFLKFLKYRGLKDLTLALAMVILIALTHFGVFCIILCFLVLALLFFYRWKAVLPIAGAVVAGILLVAVFDPGRALAMVTFWQEAFSIFISPRLLYYPFGVFNFVFSFLLAWSIIRVVRRQKELIQDDDRNILLVLMWFIVLLAFPFYGFEYGRRLGLMLFIPQALALLFLYPCFSRQTGRILTYAVLALVAFTVSIRLIHPKSMAITGESYTDMKLIRNEIDDPERTIIFARHGLEWWVAWELRVKIAATHIEVDDSLRQKYDQVFFLVQKKGENLIYPGRTSVFEKPVPPENSVLVYESEYFNLFALHEDSEYHP